MSPGVMASKSPSLPGWKYFSFRRSDTMPVGSSIPAIVNVDTKVVTLIKFAGLLIF
jgi:hypothetical protein